LDEDTITNDSPVIFDLNVKDGDLLTMFAQPMRDSEAYWNDTKKLKEVRERNMNLWLPSHWQGKEVYDYQEEYLYQDPKIFISVETICSVVNNRIPQPNVMPGQDNPISRQIAQDVQKVMYAHSTKFRVSDIFRISTRNLLLKRIGLIKLRWDANYGKDGEIVPEFVDPADMIVDQDAKWGEVPRFMGQKIRNKTGEELCGLFPDAKQQIYALLGVQRRDSKGDLVAYKTQLGKKLDIWEVWFRYWDADQEKYGGGLAYLDKNFQKVLGKMRNPNWNYKDEDDAAANVLDFPAPPYIPINYLNDGSSWIDLTTMVEQAAALQAILNRRGFQIMENAEQAGGGLIFNTNMITKADIQKLSGSPDERIGVKGNVNQAVMRVAPPPLPNYVIEDKNDARSEIDNVFATHDITRGEDSGSKTLGQDQLQQSQDYTRMDDIARAVERQAQYYYRYLAQMMKVYYTEDHWFWAAGEDGQFDHVMMKSDMIEDGVDISIETNSTLPPNKAAQLKFATELATPQLIDPLSLYEVGTGGTLPSAQKMIERLVKWRTDPMSFVEDAKTDEIDRNAFMDIQILLRGEMPKPRDDITPEYLRFLNNYMTSSGNFMKQEDDIKSLFVEWASICKTTAERQMAAMQSQLPTPEEMANANQNAIGQVQTEQALMGGGAPAPASGAPAQGGAPVAGPAGQNVAQALLAARGGNGAPAVR
jgi:hypothetical protein